MANFRTDEARDALGRWTAAAGSFARSQGKRAAAAGKAAADRAIKKVRRKVGDAAVAQREFMADQADKLPGRIQRVTAHTFNTFMAETASSKGKNAFGRYRRSLIKNKMGGEAPIFGSATGKNDRLNRMAKASRAAHVADIKRAARIGLNTIRNERKQAASHQRMLRDTNSGFNMRTGMQKAGRTY